MPMLAVMRSSCWSMTQGGAQRQENLFRTDGGILGVRHLREQNHEFIATLPADRVRAPHAGKQPLGDGLQQVVSNVVTQGVIDVLEAVHVEEQQRQLFAGYAELALSLGLVDRSTVLCWVDR